MTHSTVDFHVYPFIDSRVGYDHTIMYDLCRTQTHNDTIQALGHRPYMVTERTSCFLERQTVLSDLFKSQVSMVHTSRLTLTLTPILFS